MVKRFLGAALLALLLPLAAAAQQGRDGLAVYVFGNSLVHHLGDDPHSNVPYWMAQMAAADGRSFALDGQWGFLPDYPKSLPPVPNWSIDGVSGQWDPGRGPFGDAGYGAVVITPNNFTQNVAPDKPFEYDNPDRQTPVGAILAVADWIEARTPGTPVWIYEGWADMGPYAKDFPPSARGLRRYYRYNGGDYAEWYDALMADLTEARPGAPFHLIPVSRILNGLLEKGGLLGDMSAESLFVDNAPHGTASLYFLAAAISYATLSGGPLPEGYHPPATLDPAILAAWPEVAAYVWEQVQAAGGPLEEATAPAPEAAVQTADAAPLPPRGEVALPVAGGHPAGAPALAMGLNGISDWSTQQPFVDRMKSAREWIGHLPGQWGGVSAEELRAQGVLDENGWPLRIPEGVERLEALLLTDQPEEAEELRGTYRVFWQGGGDLEITGRARRVRYEDHAASFDYTPGEGSVGLSISRIEDGDPIRDIHVVREDQLDLWQAGEIFNPAWIARIRDLRSVRFMDWMMTNGSPVQGWADRPRTSDYTWTAWGVPLEVMIALANEIGADPWFNMPHMADDDYVRHFAETVKAGLDPRLEAYVEYSNEVWNFIFPQAKWAEARADALWGRSESGWIQYYGLRAAQVMDIWSEVYGDEAPARLVRVAGMHTGWPGLEEQVLTAPLAFLTLGRQPQESFDAYAVAGYFGYELGGEEMAAQVDDWLERSEKAATEAGEAQGLQRVALREYVRQTRFDAAVAPVAMALQEGSLRELVEEVLPYHAAAAEAAGLRLVMYEGGSHVAAQAARVNDERLTEFFEYFSYTPEMAKLYEQLLTGWVEAGGTLFNAFVDVAPPSKWGSWGALRHLDDANPRWDILTAFNASAPTDWEPRDPAVFADGILRRGGAGADRLEGTAQEDILLGGGGDDVLVGAGGSDRMNGGEGHDHAILPGAQGDYRFERDGGRLLAEGPGGTVSLFSVEVLSFEAAPATLVETAGF